MLKIDRIDPTESSRFKAPEQYSQDLEQAIQKEQKKYFAKNLLSSSMTTSIYYLFSLIKLIHFTTKMTIIAAIIAITAIKSTEKIASIIIGQPKIMNFLKATIGLIKFPIKFPRSIKPHEMFARITD
jgi:DNA integrity scanning protein DisA with diadenylate cyclase activity